jgi:hypothetical protein
LIYIVDFFAIHLLTGPTHFQLPEHFISRSHAPNKLSPHLIYIGSISPASFVAWIALHIQLRAIPLPAPSVAPQKPCSQLHCNFAAPPIAGSKSTGVSLLSFEESMMSSPLPLACSNRPLVQLIAPQREVHHTLAASLAL